MQLLIRNLKYELSTHFAEGPPGHLVPVLWLEAVQALPGDGLVAVLHHHRARLLREHRLAPLGEDLCRYSDVR